MKNSNKSSRWIHNWLFAGLELLYKNYYKMIAIYLSKQHAHDADPKAIQQINFIGNLARGVMMQTPKYDLVIGHDQINLLLDWS